MGIIREHTKTVKSNNNNKKQKIMYEMKINCIYTVRLIQYAIIHWGILDISQTSTVIRTNKTLNALLLKAKLTQTSILSHHCINVWIR